jgi:diguanylate cyclase
VRTPAHLFEAYDWRFLAEAAFLGILVALASFQVFIHFLRSRGFVRHVWLGLSSVVAGLGLWAANFSVMLAYDPGQVVVYDPAGTALSLVACMVIAAGLGPAVRSANAWRAGLLAGSYTGMVLAALQVITLTAWRGEAQVELAWLPVLAAAVTGSLFAIPALVIARRSRRWWERVAAATLLTAAVFAENLVAMSGLTIVPDPAAMLPPDGLTRGEMALAVGVVTAVLAATAFVLTAVEGRIERQARRRMRALADAATEGLVLTEDGRIRDANAAFSAIIGLDRGELRGRDFFDFVTAEDRALVPGVGGREQEIDLVAVDGTVVAAEVALRALGPEGQTVLVVRDIRPRRRAQQRIDHLAHHDLLTGLPNRVKFGERLERVIDIAALTSSSVAVLSLDLDHFKDVNDVHGPDVGDALLAEIAGRIEGELADDDFLARLGGDEFAVIQAGGFQPAAAGALAQRLINAMARDFAMDGVDINVGLHVGIALYPSHARTVRDLLADAHTALTRAKHEGHPGYSYFDAAMDSAARARRALAHDLRRAASAGELHLAYQPQIKADTGEVVAFEALARWRHPRRGLVPPTEFIAIAEENGLILEIGDWVLRRACTEAATWERPLGIAVNVSPVQFEHGDLPDRIAQILFETGLTPSRLEIEITETVLIRDFHRALSVLRRIKALGVRVAMDDFGTGYSSLSTLQAFPFDKLKIDRIFVDKLGQQPQAAAIVRAVVGLGRSLLIPVVAEGVETQQQLDFLRQQNCEELQGYLLGRPAPIDDFADVTSFTDLAGPLRELRDEAMPVPPAARTG